MPIYPISLSIHASKILTAVPLKEQLLANIVPGMENSFRSEQEYYQEYQRSWFAITTKGSGWDCMRHYEILANGCIPLFEDVKDIPTNTMTTFPIHIIQETNRFYHEISSNLNLLEEESTLIKLRLHVQDLLVYTHRILTNEEAARYILTSSGHPLAKRVLYLSQQLYPDYLRCTTLLGFKDLLGSEAHDYVKITHLYSDYDETRALYNQGFSYSKILDESKHDEIKDDTLLEDIRTHKYDLIVFGSCYRGLPLSTFVRLFYPPEDLVYLCGEDSSSLNPQADLRLSEKSHFYIREYV